MMRMLGSNLNFIVSIILAFQLLVALPASSQSGSAIFESQSANLDNAASVIRIAAIRALAKLDDAEIIASVPLIAARLYDQDPKVRIVAARTLGRFGELAKEAVTDIGRALTDSQFTATGIEDSVQFQSVAMSAAAALADLGPIASLALKDLKLALRSNDARLRAASAKAIGYIGKSASKASPALVSALSDPSAETRFEAAFALGQIGPLPDTAVSALKNSLTDEGIFTETRPSGAEVVGAVKIAAGEALLTIDNMYLDVIKQHGGTIRQTYNKEPELPWIASKRLNFSADGTDIRDLIAVVLMANQITASFRRDIEGYLTFEFRGMPAQGAFNMLMHEYNLSYEWDEHLRHVSVFPSNSLSFPKLSTTTMEPTKLQNSQNRIGLSKTPDSRKSRNGMPIGATGKAVAIRSVEKPNQIFKSLAAKKKIGVAISKVKPNFNINALNGGTDSSKRAVENSAETKKAKLVATQPVAPTNAFLPATPTDISDEHKLSFIIKYDGLYRATIDGQEFTPGMIISTTRGDMVIVDVRQRSVHLIQKAGKSFNRFVLRHRRGD